MNRKYFDRMVLDQHTLIENGFITGIESGEPLINTCFTEEDVDEDTPLYLKLGGDYDLQATFCIFDTPPSVSDLFDLIGLLPEEASIVYTDKFLIALYRAEEPMDGVSEMIHGSGITFATSGGGSTSFVVPGYRNFVGDEILSLEDLRDPSNHLASWKRVSAERIDEMHYDLEERFADQA